MACIAYIMDMTNETTTAYDELIERPAYWTDEAWEMYIRSERPYWTDAAVALYIEAEAQN